MRRIYLLDVRRIVPSDRNYKYPKTYEFSVPQNPKETNSDEKASQDTLQTKILEQQEGPACIESIK